MNSDTLVVHEEKLLDALRTRGSRRASCVRKAAGRELRKLRRQEKDTTTPEAESNVTVDPWNVPSIVLEELWLTADPQNFISSVQERVWRRDEGRAYHLAKLREPECPLAFRVEEWEPLTAQPSKYVPAPNGWNLAPDEPDDARGDPANFRDLDSLAEAMDPFSKTETCFKLVTAKPPPVAAEHADCIVFYKPSASSRRVSGSLVYDSVGAARVDVNFQHHVHEHGQFQVGSGHWHILQPGNPSHRAGLENHFDWEVCPWLWAAIPKAWGVIPAVPVGQ